MKKSRTSDKLIFDIIIEKDVMNIIFFLHEIVFDNVLMIKSKLQKSINMEKIQNYKTIIVDMQNIEYIDATAIGLGLRFYTIYKDILTLKIINLQKQPLKVIQMTGMYKLPPLIKYEKKTLNNL